MDIRTGNIICSCKIYGDSVEYIEWSPNSRYIAVVGKDQSKNKNVMEVWHVKRAEKIFVYNFDLFEPTSLAWSPDSKHVAYCDTKLVRVWEINDL